MLDPLSNGLDVAEHHGDAGPHADVVRFAHDRQILGCRRFALGDLPERLIRAVIEKFTVCIITNRAWGGTTNVRRLFVLLKGDRATGKPELPVGSEHNWNAFRLNYESKPQSMFTYTIGTRAGGYYENGTWYSITNELGYRFQPYVSLSSNISYNHINMPEPWDTTKFWLIGAKADITFTNKLFFATLFQYNEQSNKFNLNSRFQWRYKPASDLFLVYSSNYLLPPFSERVWSLTLKLTYWFNK